MSVGGGTSLGPAGVTSATIRAKLAPQRLPPGAVRRPALVDALRAGRDADLTLVCAPGGFGKTTLLTEWAGAELETDRPAGFAWVTLDPRDREPVRFWRHVIAALTAAAPGVGERSLRAMRGGPDRILDAALPLLLDDLGRVDEPLVLVLDDYVRASAPETDVSVQQLVSYRPRGLQVVVATREEPALGIPRLRASGRLVELRADLLAFTDEEAREFLAAAGVTGLGEEEERTLLTKVHGWPAPLRIAALLMPTTGRREFIESFHGGQRQLVDYLTGDVLGLLPPDRRDLLLRTSVLRRLSGSLCDHVAGASGSGGALADLERMGLFISADSAGEWFECHQLFREALRVELTRSRPDLVPVLHARAAHWFEQVGDLEQATDHAIAARDLATAARLLAAQVQPMAAKGRRDTVRRWVAELSWPEARRDPELAYARAIDAAVHSELEDVGGWLDIAATGSLDQRNGQGLPLSFRIDYLRAVTGIHDVHVAEAAGRRAVREAPSARWEGMAWCGVGQALYLQDRFDEARACLGRALALIPDSNPILLLIARANLVLVEAAGSTGPLPDRVLDGARELLLRTGTDLTPAGALIEMAWGEVCRSRGDFRAAATHFEASLDVLGANTTSCLHANALLLLGQVRLALGDATDALRSLDAADAILGRQPDPGSLPDRARRLRRAVVAAVERSAAPEARLTEREAEVLDLMASGNSQREIAAALFISHNTVKTHLRNAYRKLGVTSRDAALEARPSG